MGQVTVREAVIHLLRGFGCTTMFGNPGSTELPLFRDWPSDFRYVLGLQESVVLGMADGYAQATHNAGILNLHSAAGVGHALGNLFTAWKNGNMEEATRLQALAAELRLALKLSSFRSLVKDAMQAAGMPVGQPRRPAGSISAEEQAAIDAIVGKLRERNYLPEQIPAPRGAGW